MDARAAVDGGWRTPLATARLRLAPSVPEDAEELYAVLDDPGLHRFVGGEPLALDALRDRLGRLGPGRSADGTEVWCNWTVRLADGTAVGTAQATVDAGGADLAWVVGTAFQGRGIATEAAQAVADRLRELGVDRLTAHVRADHAASGAVAARAGLAATPRRARGEEVWEWRA